MKNLSFHVLQDIHRCLYQLHEQFERLLLVVRPYRKHDVVGDAPDFSYRHCVMEEKKPPLYTAQISYSLVNEEYWRDKRRTTMPHYCDPRGQHNKPMFCGGKLWRKVWTFNEKTGKMKELK
jgi:hypothetical protein